MPRFLNSLFFAVHSFIESRARGRLELTADNLDSAFKFRYFDNSRAKAELDWEPGYTFEQTITDTIKWMREDGQFEG